MNPADLLPTDLVWWRVLIAILIVVAGWIVSRFAKRGVLALIHRAPGISDTVAALAARVTGYAIVLLAFGVGLALLGANVQPLLAIVIIVAAILILVLRGVADNFAAGVLIQARRPVKLGDEIVIDSPDGVLIGTITELNARSVVMLTRDGRTAHVPNARILQDVIINDSEHGARRSRVQVRAESTDVGLESLLDVVREAVSSVAGVHTREHVRTLVVTTSDERTTVDVRFWHHPLHGVEVSSDVVRAVAAALKDSGIKATVTSDPGAPPLIPPDLY